METETIDSLVQLADKLSVIGVLLMAWVLERRRADRLEMKLISAFELHEAKHE